MQGPAAHCCAAVAAGDTSLLPSSRDGALRRPLSRRNNSLSQGQMRGAAVRVAAELGPRSTACQSGAQRAVEDRARQQRQHQQHHHCAELQRREAVAATVSHAYRATLEHRERQRRAAAEEQAQQHAQWEAAAAAASTSRHGIWPGGRGGSPFATIFGSTSRVGEAQPSGSVTASAANSTANSIAAAAAASRLTAQSRDSRFWMMYTMHYRRLYGGTAPADEDDCWGRMAEAAAAAAADASGAAGGVHAGGGAGSSYGASYHSQGGGAAASAGHSGSSQDDQAHSPFCEAAQSTYAYWREFARQAAAGFGFKGSATGGSSGDEGGSSAGAPGGAQQQGQQQGQQAYSARPMQPGAYAAYMAAASGTSVEQQVRAELAALLAASGGDLINFVAALGIPFERAADQGHTLKNARRAAMLSLHPDRLVQRDARERVWGHHATTLVNELWRASVAG